MSNTENPFNWAPANHPYKTGIYNGLDYVSRGYYKHIRSNFGKYPEHSSADLKCYEFKVEDIERVESNYQHLP